MSIPSNCIDCQHHRVLDDPDPQDWFCDDDKAVVCSKTPRVTPRRSSGQPVDMQEHRAVTVACRPYNLRNESPRPNWCPLVSEAPPDHATNRSIVDNLNATHQLHRGAGIF